MNRISISLDRNDWGQIVEGLEARRASWEVTTRYLEGQEVDQVIEDCHDAEEARALVATYDRLIIELHSQLRACFRTGGWERIGTRPPTGNKATPVPAARSQTSGRLGHLPA
jgi:hypothetical protein